MYQNMQYAAPGRISFLLDNLRRSGNLSKAIMVAVALLLGLLNPVFASGFAILIKFLFGLSVLGSIF